MRTQHEADFDQVIVETLPDADPAPVMQTLLNNALVTEYFRIHDGTPDSEMLRYDVTNRRLQYTLKYVSNEPNRLQNLELIDPRRRKNSEWPIEQRHHPGRGTGS